MKPRQTRFIFSRKYLQILQFAKDLHLPGVEVESTGCVGKCGNGPNVALSPDEIVFSHVATPATMARVLSELGGFAIDAAILKATELRMAANASANGGDFDEAIRLYGEAIALQPAHGLHILYSNRSAAKLSNEDFDGALEDADAAVATSPGDFLTVCCCPSPLASPHQRP